MLRALSELSHLSLGEAQLRGASLVDTSVETTHLAEGVRARSLTTVLYTDPLDHLVGGQGC